MKFVSRAWRILVAVKDALVLIAMLIFFGALYVLMSSDPNPAGGKDGALLLALDGPIVEQKTQLSPEDVLLGSATIGREYRLADVLHALDTAATDDSIKTVVLDLDIFMGAGQVTLENIGEKLDKVRAAKKPVLAFATGYFDDSYLLAAHASEVWLDPMGAAVITGPGASQPYFKGLIDRLGVTVNVYRVGKFKSAVEPFTSSAQSPEARAANQALVDTLWANWRADVAKARPRAQLANYVADPRAALAGGQSTLADAALKAGLVDKIGDRTAFGRRVAEIAGHDEDSADAYHFSTIGQYVAAHPPAPSGDKIGIVTVAGEIVDGEALAGSAGGETIAGAVFKGLAEQDLKAIVLRIDSGGGSALASEQIRQALMAAKGQGVPVVVSMGNVAASGGYWVAMGADKVFAEPSTITGSIGVFGLLPTFENTLGKYGITTDGVKTTPLSGQPDILGGTNPETNALIQAGVEDIYSRFLRLVATSRKLAVDRVNDIGQGRVWDGGTARQLGLVDGFGSLDEAVAEAARLAKIDANKVARVYLEEEPDWITSLLTSDPEASARTDIFTRLVRRQQAFLLEGFGDARRIALGPAIQVRCLSCPQPLRGTGVPQDIFNAFSAKVMTWFD